MSTGAIARPSPEPVFDEPEVEVLRGIEVPKVSPKRRHARLQLVIGELLGAWAGDVGEVGSEWRFWLSRGPDGEEISLVPDVAFVTVEQMAALDDDDAEEPPLAPTVAVEIRSPGDRERNIQTKIRLYLAYGTRLVLDVDPLARRIIAHDRSGNRTFSEGTQFEHDELPGLRFDVSELFARSDRKNS
jgi:Uma2 family endonuclease